EEILYWQGAAIIKSGGGDADSIARERRTQELLFKIIKSETDPAVAEKKAHDALLAELQSLPEEEQKKMGGDLDAVATTQVKSATSPWFRSFLTLDPRVALAKVKCPVLAINGENDV